MGSESEELQDSGLGAGAGDGGTINMIQNKKEKQVWSVEDKFSLKGLCDGQEALSSRICGIRAQKRGHK